MNSIETNDDEEDEDDEDDEEEGEEDEEDDDENLTVTMPNSFPLPSPPSNESDFQIDSEDKSSEIANPSFTLLERLENIVPKNILEVLKTVEVSSTDMHTNTDTIGKQNPSSLTCTCVFPFRYFYLSMAEYRSITFTNER